MIQVWMLILSLIAFEAGASELSHIKLSPHFEQYLTQPKLESLKQASKPLNQSTYIEEYAQKIRTTLLGATIQTKDFTSPFPRDGEESAIYDEIRNHLEAAHQAIGLREVTQLDFLNRQFNMGVENLSGFSWQKPFGVVHVFADRQVTPNLFGSNWLIQDTFSFDIEATTFLEATNSAGITEMNTTEIGAFAGITFKRVHTYYHYANSYNEGLRADFSKLFLPFMKFNLSGVEKMTHEEIMKREDNWTVSAGGIITSPAYYGFSASGGILAQFAYQNLVSVQNNEDKEQSADKIRLSVKGKKTASIGVNVRLQADFFKLLKFTILSHDLNYEYASAKEFNLAMKAHEWDQIISDITQGNELKGILRGTASVISLEPYVVTLNESDSSAFEQRGSLLIWGHLAKSKTEQIRIIKDDTVKVFFKSYAQNMRVVQNIFSRLFSAVIYKIFKLPLGAKNAAIYNRQVNMEYEATHPQATDPNIIRVENADQFSFVLNQSYEAARTDRWLDKQFKNDLIGFVDSFTTLPKDYKAIIRQEQLKGPMLIETNLRIEKAGFAYLLKQNDNYVFGNIAKVCHSNRADEWMKSDKREQFLRKLQVGSELCVKKIGTHFLEFKADYQQNSLKPSLAKFKKFISKYFKHAEGLDQLTVLFGNENTFIHGQLKATTNQNAQFVTSFSTGQFRGLGVIDNYKRQGGSRMPASIVNE